MAWKSEVEGYGAAATGLDLTLQLAEYLSAAVPDRLPAEVIAETRRGLVDWLGCALAGSTMPGPGVLLRTLKANGVGPAVVIGGEDRLSALDAALVNGTAGHVLDFDDTHMGGVILHGSSPILAALLALSAMGRVSGRDLALAYALGFDAGVRVGQAAPCHHDGGWHLTGTLGTIAAAVAAGKILGLDGGQMSHALALAATQAAGMQQNRGTMAKSFHAGRAASNGLLAAQLAVNGFDGSAEILEGRRGFIRIYSSEARPEALVDGLGTRWEILGNGHKPHACGVVLHPAIDAMIALRGQVADTSRVVNVALTVNPAAVRITGVVAPETGLKSKFSLTHAAAVSFLDAAGGVAQFGNDRAASGDVAAFAARIAVTTDPELGRDQARAEVVLADGSVVRHSVEHATGTIGNPMSDAAITAKFMANAAPVLGEARAREVAAMAWEIDGLADISELTAHLGA